MRRVTDKDIPRLKPHVGSWVLIRKATGETIGELFKANKRALKALNADNVAIIPVDEHLALL